MLSGPWRSSRPPGSSGRVRITAFLPAFHFQRFKRSRGLRLFFAATTALAKNNSLPNNLTGKHLFMFRPALRNQFILRTMRRNALQQLLKIAFRINVHRLFRQFLEIGASLRQNELFGHLEAAVEIKRADQRFECICQCGCSIPATTGFFTAPHQNVTSEIERGAMHPKCFARNQSRTQFGQLSFGFASKITEQILGNNELENGVAEKLQALIIKMIPLRLMAQAGVRERFRQQKRIAELVANAFFERCHVPVILSEIEETRQLSMRTTVRLLRRRPKRLIMSF